MNSTLLKKVQHRYINVNLLLTLRICITLLFVTAFSASGRVIAQTVNIREKTTSIRNLFRDIRSQTNLDVLWQSREFDIDRKVFLDHETYLVNELLDICIDKKKFNYVISEKSVIIIAKKGDYNPRLQDSVVYYGLVRDEKGRKLTGATIKVVGGTRTTMTDALGKFRIIGPKKGAIQISYIGFLTGQVTLNNLNATEEIVIKLTPGSNMLGEVNIVSTGYQDLPKERATGSFEVITKEQLQHSTDPNLIKRLEGITTSMDFNNQLVSRNSAITSVASTDPEQSPLARLTIRGRNTLNTALVTFGNQSGQVLVIIDGVASPYSIDNVNPDDVETITVLKDAAAASIWGSRASNGVIVIKTKRGSRKQPVNISFNSNFNITEKPDLFYTKTMSTSDYIDAQVLQFQVNGTQVTPPNLLRPQRLLSPVVEILGLYQNGTINASQAGLRIDSLRGFDVRNDFNKYILRKNLSQNYSLSVGGGGEQVGYRFSTSYNDDKANSVNAGSNRLGFSLSTTYRPIRQLDINAMISYFVRKTFNQVAEQSIGASISSGQYYPYTRLADDSGNPTVVPFKYRSAFIDLISARYGTLVKDLKLRPLENINEGYYKTIFKDLNFNLGLKYNIDKYLQASTIFSYTIGNNDDNRYNSSKSFYMRDLITFFTTPNGVKNVPEGGTYRTSNTNSKSLSLRTQLDYNRTFNKSHSIDAIAGVEVTDADFLTTRLQYYGYDEERLTLNNQLNFKDRLPTLFYSPIFLPTSQIPLQPPAVIDGSVRTLSFFSNAAYTFKGRYTISGSVRKDMSSQFGIGTNKGGTPFFSTGAKWNIANEPFYQLSWLPTLQFRTTFGYNGNVNPAISARPLIAYSLDIQENNLLSATETSLGVSNSKLRPERTSTLNTGIDFGFKDNRISGSIEYYERRTFDLLASNIIDPSTGFNSITYNTANLRAWGTDFNLVSQNIRSGKFGWTSNFLFSYNRVKVTRIYTPQALTAEDAVIGRYNEGADLSRIYAYSWAGLDPSSGDPRGYLNGQATPVTNLSDYLNLIGKPLSTARYFGSAVPVYYGSLRNTFTIGSFAISANLLYKLGYYFRRSSVDVVDYSQLFNPSGRNFVQGIEYAKRWKAPGDENNTNVPSMRLQSDGYRDYFYRYAEINVLKADHIRLQEVNFSYVFRALKGILKNPRVYANISNLGLIIWRANQLGLDPDTFDYPLPKTYSFGISANF